MKFWQVHFDPRERWKGVPLFRPREIVRLIEVKMVLRSHQSVRERSSVRFKRCVGLRIWVVCEWDKNWEWFGRGNWGSWRGRPIEIKVNKGRSRKKKNYIVVTTDLKSVRSRSTDGIYLLFQPLGYRFESCYCVSIATVPEILVISKETGYIVRCNDLGPLSHNIIFFGLMSTLSNHAYSLSSGHSFKWCETLH